MAAKMVRSFPKQSQVKLNTGQISTYIVGCVFTTALVSLNIPEGVLFIDSVKRLKNFRCFHE